MLRRLVVLLALGLGVCVRLASADTTTGLALWLEFTTAGTTQADSATGDGAQNATLSTPAPTYVATGCRAGPCYSFNGTDNYMTGAAAIGGTTAITMTAWINLTVASASQMDIYSDVADAYTLRIDQAPSTSFVPSMTVQLPPGGPGNWFDCFNDAVVPAGTWTHLAGVWDGVDMRMYVNGSLGTSSPCAAAGPAFAAPGNYRIGVNSILDGRFFGGSLDNIRVYTRALTAADVAEDMALALAQPQRRRPLIVQHPRGWYGSVLASLGLRPAGGW